MGRVDLAQSLKLSSAKINPVLTGVTKRPHLRGFEGNFAADAQSRLASRSERTYLPLTTQTHAPLAPHSYAATVRVFFGLDGRREAVRVRGGWTMNAAYLAGGAQPRSERLDDSQISSDCREGHHAPELRLVQAPRPRTPHRIAAHLAQTQYDAATLIVDVQGISEQYDRLARGVDPARIYYAVKANPEAEVLKMLAGKGSRFDVASRGEIDMCLAAGATPEQLSFGNTLKKERDIAYARRLGLDLFVFDSDEELGKLARSAPGARVFCRLLMESSEADWPLSRKFGCPPEEAVRLSLRARELGLNPVGYSFHVGSQAREPEMWRGALAEAARTFALSREAGLTPYLMNMGGGFPATYEKSVLHAEVYARRVMEFARSAFGGELPAQLMAEPGRGLVAEAGVIETEVVLASRKRPEDPVRWVYLDVGKFTGLPETQDEAIRYVIETPHDGGETGPCILAGPTCDSADVMYEKATIQLPLALQAGDKVRILATGAYTSTYSAVGFNGFAPLKVVCV